MGYVISRSGYEIRYIKLKDFHIISYDIKLRHMSGNKNVNKLLTAFCLRHKQYNTKII